MSPRVYRSEVTRDNVNTRADCGWNSKKLVELKEVFVRGRKSISRVGKGKCVVGRRESCVGVKLWCGVGSGWSFKSQSPLR